MFRHIYISFSLLISCMAFMIPTQAQERLAIEETYQHSRQWEYRNFTPALVGGPTGGNLPSLGDIKILNGQLHFTDVGGRSDKRSYQKLGAPLSSEWKLDVDFSPISGSTDGVNHLLLALTAGTQHPLREVSPTVTSSTPWFGSSITDQDAIFIEYNCEGANKDYSNWFLRIGYKDGTNKVTQHKIKPAQYNFQLGDVQYLRLELTNAPAIKLSLYGDAERTDLKVSKTLAISSPSEVPQGLHVLQHSNVPQSAWDKTLTATLDNVRIFDSNLPCIRCADQSLALSNENRIVNTIVREPAQSLTEVGQLSNGGEKWVNVAYFDGIGRPTQELVVQGSANCQGDLVNVKQYDAFGRESERFLPFADAGNSGSLRTDGGGGAPISLQQAFYQTSHAHFGQDLNALSAKTVFEPSPLHRVWEQGAPGMDWQPIVGTDGFQANNEHTVVTEYLSNDVPVDALHPTQPFGNGLYTYAPGSFHLTRSYDENGHMKEIAKDKLGRTIYEKAQAPDGEFAYTMYHYDDHGRLDFAIAPEGIEMLTDEGFSHLSSNQRDHFGYDYKYDAQGRMRSKWIPSNNQTGWTHYIYNDLDQVILSTNANQAEKSPQEWSFTKYDALGRPIMTGIYRDDQNLGQYQLQLLVDNFYALHGSDAQFEYRSTAGHGYSNQSFPILGTDTDLHSVTYYDDYDFDRDGSPDRNYAVGLTDFPDNQETDRTRGMVTGVKLLILDKDPAMPNWLWTVTFYDKYGRELQTQADNHLGGIDVVTNSYNFAGELLFTKRIHQGYSSATGPGQAYVRSATISSAFSYDHRGRLIQEMQKTEDQGNQTDFTTIAANRYNVLGQESRKNILFDGGNQFLQKRDYRYNVRGWLTDINSFSFFTTAGQAYHDLFALKLHYNDLADPQARYNGNIARMEWQVLGPNINHHIQRYDLAYDVMNRLTEATYQEESFSAIHNIDRYTVDNLKYSLGGNILTMNRYGKIDATTYGLMDQLDYYYEMPSSADPRGNSNRLRMVSDGAIGTEIAGVEQFVDGANLSQEYTYDFAGNLTSDANKGIASITYNHLNKPTSVTMDDGRWLAYIYSADGTKLRQHVYGSSGTTTLIKTTDYIAGIQYENDYEAQFSTAKIVQMPHSEGRVRLSGTDLIYEGFLTDHLGNTRVVFADIDGDHVIDRNLASGEVLQLNGYYPFGMRIATDQNVISPNANQYLYNGKEQQDELGFGWIDYGARMYDPTIARWNGRDALSEESMTFSPYNYVLGNPINMIDPDGNLARYNWNRGRYEDIYGNEVSWEETMSEIREDEHSTNFIVNSLNYRLTAKLEHKAGLIDLQFIGATVPTLEIFETAEAIFKSKDHHRTLSISWGQSSMVSAINAKSGLVMSRNHLQLGKASYSYFYSGLSQSSGYSSAATPYILSELEKFDGKKGRLLESTSPESTLIELSNALGRATGTQSGQEMLLHSLNIQNQNGMNYIKEQSIQISGSNVQRTNTRKIVPANQKSIHWLVDYTLSFPPPYR